MKRAGTEQSRGAASGAEIVSNRKYLVLTGPGHNYILLKNGRSYLTSFASRRKIAGISGEMPISSQEFNSQ
jgi:hypothetical protein